MSFNWYRIAKIQREEKRCLELDRQRFAGIETEELEVKPLEPNQTVEDIDTTHQYKHIGDRIQEGKQREDDFIQQINESTPFILEHAGDRQDISGIDAFIVGYKGGKMLSSPLSVQIKHRLKGGDDLGLEVVKGWPPLSMDIRDIDYNGKDMKTAVDYYFHVDRGGTVRVFQGSLIRRVAQEMFTSALVAWGHQAFTPSDKFYNTKPYGQVRIVSEQGRGGRRTRNNSKVITYIDVTKLKPTYTFNL